MRYLKHRYIKTSWPSVLRLGTSVDYPSTKEVDYHQHQAKGFGGTSPFHEKSSVLEPS